MGHLVRELDASGGLMGRVADRACIQFRRRTRARISRSKPALVDIDLYPQYTQETLEGTKDRRDSMRSLPSIEPMYASAARRWACVKTRAATHHRHFGCVCIVARTKPK